MIFLTIFIKASFFSEQLPLTPRPTYIVLSSVPPSPLECTCRFSGLRDPEDCVLQGVSPGLSWGHSQHFPGALQLAEVDMTLPASSPGLACSLVFLLSDVVCIYGFSILSFLWLECEPHQDRVVFCFWPSPRCSGRD